MVDDDAIAAMIEYLRLSGNIRELQRALTDVGSASGRSWDAIKGALLHRDDDTGVEALIATAWDAILWGRKTLRLFAVSDAVRTAAGGYSPPAFTLERVISPTPPADGEANQPVLAHVLRTEASLTLIYRSTRMISRKTPIPEEWLDEKYRPVFRLGDEAYVISRHPAVAYDCVEVPLDGGFASLRMATDFAEHTLVADVEDITVSLLAKARADLGCDEIWDYVDIFDAIASIYADGTEGRIVELQFECTTGATRAERMRRSETDLRLEAYHQAGVQVTDIHPFLAGVRWPDRPDTELVLPGTRRMLNLSAGNRLFEAIIRARRPQDYRFAYERLLAHLDPPAQAAAPATGS